jgi:hypothetical protein
MTKSMPIAMQELLKNVSGAGRPDMSKQALFTHRSSSKGKAVAVSPSSDAPQWLLLERGLVHHRDNDNILG